MRMLGGFMRPHISINVKDVSESVKMLWVKL